MDQTKKSLVGPCGSRSTGNNSYHITSSRYLDSVYLSIREASTLLVLEWGPAGPQPSVQIYPH